MRQFFIYMVLTLASLTARAQFTAGPDGFYIEGATPVALDGLTLIPDRDVTIDKRTLSVSGIPVAGSPNGSIRRVYTFDAPLNFSGLIGIFYRPQLPEDELNGNSEANLAISYSASESGSFVITAGSTAQPGNDYVFNTVANQDLSSVTATDAGNALPVTLIEFNIKKESQTALLSWTTTFETNSSFFQIQRSKDAKNWQILGQLAAQGESMVNQFYTFADAKPILNVNNFYRLKMTDLDGTSAYSSIRKVSFDNAIAATLYPNPTAEKLTIQVDDWSKVNSIQIVSLQGTVLYDSLAQPSKNGPPAEIDMKLFPAGTYIVKINRVGGDFHSLKVIRQ